LRAKAAAKPIRAAATPAFAAPPDWKSGPVAELWPRYFRENRPDVQTVQALVLTLSSAEQHEHIVSVIESALINGQAQPWMYEVLALSMEITGRPKDDIERVVLSLSDFGGADFGSMMMSAAYLTQFGRREASLRLYRQASRLAPERAEPYILGLKHARHVQSAEDVEWAACGILQYAWTRDFAELHRDAENAALEAERRLRVAGDAAGADRLKAALADARRRDLIVRLHWSGGGDLDLIVEEPSGAVCSFQSRETPGGGVLTHDGYGPDTRNCYEEYICAQGVRGEYRLRVQHAWGQIVGGRATLSIVKDAGSPEEAVESHAIVLGADETVIRVDLPEGRRTQLRTAGTFDVRGMLSKLPPEHTRPQAADPAARDAALAEFEDSRRRTQRLAGAVGFQPIIQIIPDGVQLSALAVVSADRRYVRISTLPLFTNITDVATFSFISGAGGTIGGGGGGGNGTGGNTP
jgi:hypothetical protein